MENFYLKSFYKKDQETIHENVNEKLSLELEENKESRIKKEANWHKWVKENKDLIEEPLNDSSLLEAMGSLTFKVEEYLSEYDTIISDDTSGRIPSLILRNVASAKDKKESTPKTYFIAGGVRLKKYEETRSYDDLDKSINKFIDGHKDTIKKPLIITEVISSGKSLEALIKRFHKFDIYPDIATISTYQLSEEGRLITGADEFDKYANNLKTRIFYGKEGGVGEAIYGNFKGKGVKKQKTGIFKRINSPHPEINKDEKVSDIRKSVKLISDGLISIIKE